MATTETRKAIASEFLQATASGAVREVYRKHVADNFRHHNPFFKGDAQSLMIAMEENHEKIPDKILEIKHIIAEGDLVIIHSRVDLQPTNIVVGLVHIFRFEGDKIVELWDLGQAVPENSPNEHGMF